MPKPKIKVKMNARGAAAILKGDSVMEDLAERAERIAVAAGDGFEARTWHGRTRALASVVGVTDEANEAEATGRVLTSALDAGR